MSFDNYMIPAKWKCTFEVDVRKPVTDRMRSTSGRVALPVVPLLYHVYIVFSGAAGRPRARSATERHRMHR